MNLPSDHELKWWTNYWAGMHKMPRAWAHKGENLFHAFEAVAAASVENSFHLNMHDQALMLAGMSVEVMLKAILITMPGVYDIIVDKKKNLPEWKKNLRNTLYSHNLVNLAKESNIPFTPEQHMTAEMLTKYIVWRGRYVVPKGNENGIKELMPFKPELTLHKLIVSGNTWTYYPNDHVFIAEARGLMCYVISVVKERLDVKPVR
jgi:hypothetical protein